jgi:hypothetical protein
VGRRTIAILLTAVMALILAPIALLLMAEPAVAPAPSHSEDAAGPVRLNEIAWVFAPIPVPGIDDGSFVLQAGTLADEEPLVDLEVRWAADLGADLTREPAVGPPIRGSVVYVEDDGAMSVVHLAAIARDGSDEVVARIPDVVWDVAVAPDNSVAYAALTDRESRERDLGVVRIHLDGSGAIEEVMPPSEIGEAHDISLAAFIGFNVELIIADEGGHLARRACAGSEGCMIEVIDLASGAISPMPDGELNGLAEGFLVVTRCDDVACRPHAVEMATGSSLELLAEVPVRVMSAGGRPTAIATSVDQDQSTSIDAIDILSGDREVLLRTDPGSWASVDRLPDLDLDVPPGYLHLTHSTPQPDQGGAVVEMQHQELLVELDGGNLIEIPTPPFRPPPGFGVQG